ncbi:MAG: SCP2 sterol-binding domain-containing protein, partial [Deltaproteobacteria bacterium]|nr:SCP2 sterol-binding domain-containing protein [Deltaproteobacteria bacterium]
LIIAIRWDKPGYFEWVTAGYFGIVFIFLLFWPNFGGKVFARYAVTGIFVCLFSAAFFPPIAGMEPFTCHYARGSTPMAHWENPAFISINRIMTHVWAGIFALCMVISLYPSVITRAVIPISLILGIGLPFNLGFPDIYLKRLGLPSLAEQRKIAQLDSESKPRSDRVPELPQSAWEAVSGMAETFDADAAGILNALIGFIVTGSESFETYLSIRGGTCSVETSPPRKPDLIIRTPAHVWLGIARGEIDGRTAFSRQAYTAEGDLGLLLNMRRIFGGKQYNSIES